MDEMNRTVTILEQDWDKAKEIVESLSVRTTKNICRNCVLVQAIKRQERLSASWAANYDAALPIYSARGNKIFVGDFSVLVPADKENEMKHYDLMVRFDRLLAKPFFPVSIEYKHECL